MHEHKSKEERHTLIEKMKYLRGRRANLRGIENNNEITIK